MSNISSFRFVFFGTAPLADSVLNELEAVGALPALVVAGQDVPGRRGKEAMPPIEKQWALKRNIPVLQPEKLDSAFLSHLQTLEVDLFVVASYGKILPKALLDIPKLGTVNLHPSLLPRLRGPSPIRSAILNNDAEVGVSIMLLDHEMDHGPIIAQKKVPMPYIPMRGRELDVLLAGEGAKLLAQVLPLYASGELIPQEQNHDVATYCGFFKKEDGLVDMNGDPHQQLLKIRAFDGWPGAYTFFNVNGVQTRVKILDAHIDNNMLILDTVVPEGGRPMSFNDFSTIVD
jgi:methionyl-tRNA formyltransferase